ncbi:glutathione S-transferase family protein [Rhodanobacter sp. AS-Z3]|uniref:glutathione S-transferase family protein n=1 Tax=Rhodanobacter sp. AS-Z3 TaxID=3031330 RepID=UPI00247AD47D|nr:glutathione S-transferase family protein [Rhodanobacter sp. AS-Z3]WEN15869.1 glutathione S-transferase family protein [Rhodanobacter sp. AS-Z3]
MYQLHIANKNYSSWSLRPWLLLSELGIPFEEQLVTFAQGSGSSWQVFRAFSPNGKVPCLHDGERVVWDSLAIVEYLADRHVDVWPSDPDARAWARCAAAEMHAGFAALRNQCGMNCGLRIHLPDALPAALHADVSRIDELWGEGLTRFGGPFLAGVKFGAVDAFFAPVAFRIQTYGLNLGAASMAYVRRVLALPGMQRWYAAALQESWRDEEHETEAQQSGRVWQDLRVPTA